VSRHQNVGQNHNLLIADKSPGVKLPVREVNHSPPSGKKSKVVPMLFFN
jgi:hypothetical protein